LQGFAGRRNIRIPAGGTWEARELFGIFDTLEFGNTLLRGGFIQSHLTSDTVNSLFDLFRQFGTQGALIADRYDVNDAPIDVWILGGRYDPGEWFLMAEWTRAESRSFLGKDAGWYVSSGYRLKQFTPYASYAQRDDLDSSNRPALPVAFLPPFLQGFASVLNAELDNLLQPNASTTWTIGTRWDFMENFSFKVQLDHIVLGDNSKAALINIQPGFKPGEDLDVISATIDFVF
jgi:predicted porin